MPRGRSRHLLYGATLGLLGLAACGDSDGRRVGSHRLALFPGGAAGPLLAGTGPETANECPAGPGSTGVPAPGSSVVTTCFYDTEVDAEAPAAMSERIIEVIDNVEYVHVRLTMSPYFVDNSYGETAVGWEESKKGGHKFKELVGSDHAEMLFTDGTGTVALHLIQDLISEDPSRPSGYGSLGVTGGKNDGDVMVGGPDDVLAATTSMDRNLNGCGYGSFTENSPVTDELFSPSPEAEFWDYRAAYELWLRADAFGGAGFGDVTIEFVHASPSKTGDNTIIVEERPCPPPGCVIGPDEVCRYPEPPPPPPEPPAPDDCTTDPDGIECADII